MKAKEIRIMLDSKKTDSVPLNISIVSGLHHTGWLYNDFFYNIKKKELQQKYPNCSVSFYCVHNDMVLLIDHKTPECLLYKSKPVNEHHTHLILILSLDIPEKNKIMPYQTLFIDINESLKKITLHVNHKTKKNEFNYKICEIIPIKCGGKSIEMIVLEPDFELSKRYKNKFLDKLHRWVNNNTILSDSSSSSDNYEKSTESAISLSNIKFLSEPLVLSPTSFKRDKVKYY